MSYYILVFNILDSSRKSRGIQLISPYRINQKAKNIPEEIKILKDRSTIEHCNNFLKQNKLIQTRHIKIDNAFTLYTSSIY